MTTPATLEIRIFGSVKQPLVGAMVSYERLFTPVTNPAQPPRGVASTDRSGLLRFQNLAAGNYSICVNVPGSAYLNPCEWEAPVIVNLMPGELKLGLPVVLTQGAFLHLRADDPNSLLPSRSRAPGKANSATPLLHMVVWADKKGFPHIPDLLAEDASGQSYVLAVPKGRDLTVTLAGKNLSVVDNQGQAKKDLAHQIPVRFEGTDDQKQIRFHVQR
jgi:hypothetical protein